MIKNSIYILLLFLLSCSSNQIYIEKNDDKLNFIKVNIIQLFNYDDKVEIQLQITCPTNRLVFEKNSKGFSSHLSINTIFTNENNKVLFSDNWNFGINKKYFEETKSNKDILISKNIFVDRDISNLNLIIDDFKNNISWIKNKNIRLSKNIHLSDIFLNKKSDNKYSQILDNELVNVDTLWINFYSQKIGDSLRLAYNFFIQERNNLDREIVTFYEKKYISKDNNHYPIYIPNKFFNGLEITIESSTDKKIKEILIDRYEEIDYDYTILVGPMEYILENSNFKKYREYADMDYEDKLDYIKNYWMINDSGENQIFQEFYNRVEYVNSNFNYLSFQGWETDRGKIFIIYGYPYDIQKEYTPEGEYEIWTYKNNKQFIFVNKYGEYVLSKYN